ncbi:MAG: hypothetical protein WAO98_06760 [Alphaproteobacteria bacterium]
MSKVEKSATRAIRNLLTAVENDADAVQRAFDEAAQENPNGVEKLLKTAGAETLRRRQAPVRRRPEAPQSVLRGHLPPGYMSGD